MYRCGTSPNFKTYYKITTNLTVQNWLKDKQINETDPRKQQSADL